MAGGATPGARQLDQTPTWAVASVCFIIVLISIILEEVIHKVAKKKKALLEALDKIKSELMILGFISLLLTFGQNYIAKICIPVKYGNTMLPCTLHAPLDDHHHPLAHAPPLPHGDTHGEAHGDIHGEAHGEDEAHGGDTHGEDLGEDDAHAGDTHGEDLGAHGEDEAHAGDTHGEDHGEGEGEGKASPDHRRRLLSYHDHRRFLGGDSPATGCKPGYVPLISVNGLHQLHIFIFFLAVFHVLYSAITMTLGRLKIRGWKEWEQSNLSDQEAMNDPSRFRLTHETSFVRDHNRVWTKTPVSFYFVCFFRQFFRSVRKADYLTMRHGFVTVHLTSGSKFDFQKYIKRSLEDDFKVVVGISPMLWASVVFFLLINVHGWNAMLWVSFLPLGVILAVGTKLQAIITRMALDIQERHAVVQGIPLVQVSDKHFWFEWPQLVLYLIHFVLFQNAFELTYFLWTWYEFGLRSCFHEDLTLLAVRITLGIGAQIVCSYVTLPLYALVTQMGSTMKKSIFDDQTSKALMNWHKNALKKKNSRGRSPTRAGGTAADGSTELKETTATILTSVDVAGPGSEHHT
ncbi:MLO-like protein 9 [Senna tora]|uniref:MLO-like protein n=1 Tax=Senna tora TaxID=362788 RepID=A0A834WP07_9FABA|nr:MLO-like protein 9 [Senna tora]